MQADLIEPSSSHELNTLVALHQHNISQETWTRDNRLLWLFWQTIAAAPPVLPAPPPPPPVVPAAPTPPAFVLGPGSSHAVLDYDNPDTGATATKLYNKAISPLKEKFDGEVDNLVVFLASVHDRARWFNWHCLIMVPIDNRTTRNLLTNYGQVSLENTRTHATTYVNTPTRDAQDNDMFYYFSADSLTKEF